MNGDTNRIEQTRSSGKLLTGFKIDHEHLHEKRIRIFNELLDIANDSDKTLILTIEEILYHTEVSPRQNPNTASEMEMIEPFNWTGPARVEQMTLLKFIESTAEIDKIILDKTNAGDAEFVANILRDFKNHILTSNSFHGPTKTCPVIYTPGIFDTYFTAFLLDYISMKRLLLENSVIEPTLPILQRGIESFGYINLLRE